MPSSSTAATATIVVNHHRFPCPLMIAIKGDNSCLLATHRCCHLCSLAVIFAIIVVFFFFCRHCCQPLLPPPLPLPSPPPSLPTLVHLCCSCFCLPPLPPLLFTVIHRHCSCCCCRHHHPSWSFLCLSPPGGCCLLPQLVVITRCHQHCLFLLFFHCWVKLLSWVLHCHWSQ